MENTRHPFLRIAAISAVLAPLTLLAGDALMIFGGRRFEFSLALWLAFVFFVPAILGITFLAYSAGSRLSLVGGASAFFGAMAGASMQVLFRVYAVFEEVGATEPVALLQGTLKLIATTQMIGIFFPIGLITLAICFYRRRVFEPFISLLLIAGAVAFPIGRIGGFAVAVLSSGVLLALAFGLMGWKMLAGDEKTSPVLEESLASAN